MTEALRVLDWLTEHRGLDLVLEEALVGGAAIDAAYHRIERALAGVAERRMTEVVGQRQHLGEVLVEPERARQRAGYLGDFERMGQPCAVMVALVIDEDLRLVGEAPERGRMDDAVAIAAKVVARRACRLGMQPAAGRARIGGKNCATTASLDRH